MKILPRRNHRTKLATGWLLSVLMMVASSVSAQYPEPMQTKLFSRAKSGFVGNAFGEAVAISDRFLLVGEYANDDKGANAGAAYLYNPRTGRFLRQWTAGVRSTPNASFGGSTSLSGNLALIGALGSDGYRGSAFLFNAQSGRRMREFTAPDGTPNDYLGQGVALNSDLALVGAPGRNGGRGAAYLFSVRNGGFLRQISPADVAPNDGFGRVVALSGPLALIGASGNDNQRGAAYLYDTLSGQLLFKLTASDRQVGDYFGDSLAISGGRALVGAPSKDAGDGAVYVFDARTGAELRKIVTSATNSYFGYSVAINGELALIGADNEDATRGAAYLFRIDTGDLLSRIVPENRGPGHQFGTSAALSNQRALVGASGDDDRGASAGAAHLLRPLPMPLTMTSVATQGQAAGVAGDAFFRGFSRAHVKPSGDSVLLASLSGPGSRGGRNHGVWHEISGAAASQALRVRDTDVGGGLQVVKILDLLSSLNNTVLIRAQLRGPGVNSSNRQALLRHDALGLHLAARTGTEFGGFFPGILPRQFRQVVQSGPSLDQVAASVQLQRGQHGVTAANDSAICVFNHAGNLLGVPHRVGSPVEGGGSLGHLVGRLAQSHGTVFCAFSGAWFPPADATAKRALFFSDGFASPVRNATEGIMAPNADGALYRSILAEGIGSSGYSLWRASLSGPNVTPRTNEGLWHASSSGFRLVARKGQEVDPTGKPGVKISRLLRFWPARGDGQVVLLIRLTGPGINASRDLALCLWDRLVPEALHVLLQEGDPVEGTNGRRVRVLQRVDVDSVNGHYVVQCSLTGSSVGNQALLTGFTGFGTVITTRALRQPVLRLHKGRLHLRESGPPTHLRGITLTPVLDKTGAGGKGLGQAINHNGSVSARLTFDGKHQEVRSGVP